MIILGVEDQTGQPSKLSPDPGEAFVIFDGGGTKVLHTGERLSPAEIHLRRRRKVVRIATSEQATAIDGTVIAADGFRTFQVHLTAAWKVSDFVKAAEAGTVDIDAALRTAVAEKLAELDRRHQMTEFGADAVSSYLREELQFRVIDFVQIVDIGGRVELDSSHTGHLKDVHRTHESTEVRHEQLVGAKQIERERTELDEEVAQLRRANALREEQARLELERERTQLSETIAKLTRANELREEQNRIEIERMRQAFLRDMEREKATAELEVLKQKLDLFGELSGTMRGLITLQLAEDPTKVEVAIRGVRAHQASMAQLNFDAVKALISGDGLEGYQMADSAKLILRRFLEFALGSVNTALEPSTDPAAATPDAAAFVMDPAPLDPQPPQS